MASRFAQIRSRAGDGSAAHQRARKRQKQEANTMTQPSRAASFAVALDDIPDTVLVSGAHLTGGAITAKIAYGTDSSVIVATREPGYHSKPHRHDAEQMNYVLAGELIVFIDDTAIAVREGDIFRVPRNALHWSWVRGDRPCVLIEFHAPPLIGSARLRATAVALAGQGESLAGVAGIDSDWPEIDQAAAERRMLARAAIDA
jgi:quercetin dioxygenase-like cupin family protein